VLEIDTWAPERFWMYDVSKNAHIWPSVCCHPKVVFSRTNHGPLQRIVTALSFHSRNCKTTISTQSGGAICLSVCIGLVQAQVCLIMGKWAHSLSTSISKAGIKASVGPQICAFSLTHQKLQITSS
jgi:hypothetical protein